MSSSPAVSTRLDPGSLDFPPLPPLRDFKLGRKTFVNPVIWQRHAPFNKIVAATSYFAEVGSSRKIVSPKLARLVNGKPCVCFPDEEIDSLAAPFNLTLLGKFSSTAPHISEIAPVFKKMAFNGAFTVSFVDHRHIAIRLFVEEGYASPWAKGVVYVNGVSMKLLKWTPTFKPQVESLLVAAWITIKNLPLMFFNAEALFDIASLVGKPLKVDSTTACRSRLDRAGVCVEIDVSKPLVESILVEFLGELLELKVEFDKNHFYCNHCCKLGHCEDLCRIKYPELGKVKAGKQTLEKGEDVGTLKFGEQKKIMGLEKVVDEDGFTLVSKSVCGRSGDGILERGVGRCSLLSSPPHEVSPSHMPMDRNPFSALVENDGFDVEVEESLVDPILSKQSPSLSSRLVTKNINSCHDSLSGSDREGEDSSLEKGKPFDAFVDGNFGGHLDYYEGVPSSSEESSSKKSRIVRRRSHFVPIGTISGLGTHSASTNFLDNNTGQEIVGRRSDRLLKKSQMDSKYLAKGNDFIYDIG